MRLESISLHGFKSFAEKTTVKVLPGVTGIVGPNGCGKSNISEAVRWALGEQSAKSLRGQRMEDLIFHGSASRKAVGLAEVELVFSNDGAVSVPWSEIAVGRRLYRTGESEYQLNKSACRLRDMLDLFAGTGANPRAYSVMDQDKLNHVLTAKPHERRVFIEEAAGIARYKQQRQETQGKLEATRQNLVRVRDVMDEVKRQLGSLERQAKKAQQYKALQGERRELALALAAADYAALTTETERLAEALAPRVTPSKRCAPASRPSRAAGSGARGAARERASPGRPPPVPPEGPGRAGAAPRAARADGQQIREASEEAARLAEDLRADRGAGGSDRGRAREWPRPAPRRSVRGRARAGASQSWRRPSSHTGPPSPRSASVSRPSAWSRCASQPSGWISCARRASCESGRLSSAGAVNGCAPSWPRSVAEAERLAEHRAAAESARDRAVSALGLRWEASESGHTLAEGEIQLTAAESGLARRVWTWPGDDRARRPCAASSARGKATGPACARCSRRTGRRGSSGSSAPSRISSKCPRGWSARWKRCSGSGSSGWWSSASSTLARPCNYLVDGGSGSATFLPLEHLPAPAAPLPDGDAVRWVARNVSAPSTSLVHYLLGQVGVVEHLDDAEALWRRNGVVATYVTPTGEVLGPTGRLRGGGEGSAAVEHSLLTRKRQLRDLEREVIRLTAAVERPRPRPPSARSRSRRCALASLASTSPCKSSRRSAWPARRTSSNPRGNTNVCIVTGRPSEPSRGKWTPS